MEEIHVTREILAAVAEGELPGQVLTRISLEHLLSLCPVCREEMSAYLGTPAGPLSPGYLKALEAVLEQHEPRMVSEESNAHQDLKKLLALPREKRAGALSRAQKRFRSGIFIRLLLRASEEQLYADPAESFHLAELARIATQHSPTLLDVFDLLTLSTAAMANARRAGGHLREAEALFARSRSLAKDDSVTDPLVLARLDELEGSLRKDQRLFARAGELFSRASLLYRLSGSRREQVRILLKLADVHFYEGSVATAITTVRKALKRIQRKPSSRLYLCGRYNLARYLVEADRFIDASEVLAQDEALYAHFPESWTQLRLTWLQGKIAAGLGHTRQAEERFLKARDGFIAEGIGYDAAMVVVEDLALLYLSHGQTDNVKRLAEESTAIFAAQDVHREAIAALMLFQDAARQETLTRSLLKELSVYFQTTRHDPSVPFTRP